MRYSVVPTRKAPRNRFSVFVGEPPGCPLSLGYPGGPSDLRACPNHACGLCPGRWMVHVIEVMPQRYTTQRTGVKFSDADARS